MSGANRWIGKRHPAQIGISPSLKKVYKQLEQSPDTKPEGSPVGAGSSVGPDDCIWCASNCVCLVHPKSPNTPRESRAVNDETSSAD